jgi:hypothetical protein
MNDSLVCMKMRVLIVSVTYALTGCAVSPEELQAKHDLSDYKRAHEENSRHGGVTPSLAKFVAKGDYKGEMCGTPVTMTFSGGTTAFQRTGTLEIYDVWGVLSLGGSAVPKSLQMRGTWNLKTGVLDMQSLEQSSILSERYSKRGPAIALLLERNASGWAGASSSDYDLKCRSIVIVATQERQRITLPAPDDGLRSTTDYERKMFEYENSLLSSFHFSFGPSAADARFFGYHELRNREWFVERFASKRAMGIGDGKSFPRHYFLMNFLLSRLLEWDASKFDVLEGRLKELMARGGKQPREHLAYLYAYAPKERRKLQIADQLTSEIVGWKKEAARTCARRPIVEAAVRLVSASENDPAASALTALFLSARARPGTPRLISASLNQAHFNSQYSFACTIVVVFDKAEVENWSADEVEEYDVAEGRYVVRDLSLQNALKSELLAARFSSPVPFTVHVGRNREDKNRYLVYIPEGIVLPGASKKSETVRLD